jgi:uncharacterized protein YbjT (DUF2867 family)
MSLPRIALAGATGNLGLPVLSALLSAGYSVTALTRIGGKASKLPSNANLTVAPVDFTSVASLSPALDGVQVVVSCFATAALGSQIPLIGASVTAGVTRFIPADFGMDTQNPLAIQLPVGKIKYETQGYLREQAARHPGFSWTAIAVGWFLDWTLQMGIIADVKNRTATLFNGGDVPVSATTLADVAKAVIGVIEHQDETANRLIFVQSARVTQNQLIQYAKEKDGREWNTNVKSTEEVRKEVFEELEQGDDAGVEIALAGQCNLAMFTTAYGCDFEDRLDNDVVGVEILGEKEIREIVESCM